MGKYRTAQGKILDMTALAAKNDRTRAVGNQPVNARGDVIDSMGRVVVPANEKVNKTYSKTVGNKSAQPVKNTSTPPTVNKPIQETFKLEELSQYEKELELDSENDIEVEQIKQQEVEKGKKGKKQS
jgi:hypothetical protein